jgi:UPF0042 nucleotide-binding protein
MTSVTRTEHSHIIILTGLSGAGKRTSVAVFEDAGYFCVENMPIELLPEFLELPIESDNEIAGLVFVMDLRSSNFIKKYADVFDKLTRKGYNPEIIFLEADESVLQQRFSQTRRPHPLTGGNNLLERIRAEKIRLAGLRKVAETIIDTTHLNVHELKVIIRSIARRNIRTRSMRIDIVSFGYKYGIPSYADLVMDVRFLPNPYFEPELKALDGENDAVRNFVLEKPETFTFLNKYFDFLDYLIPQYRKEGKAYLTIAIGCTGGRHRSVAVSRAMFERLKQQGLHINIDHRDIDK